MKRIIIITIILIIYSVQSPAHKKARGLSKPGSLMKKKDVIIDSGKESGIFEDQKAKPYLSEKLLKKRGKCQTGKKMELVELPMNCGANLICKVPTEILDVQKN